MTSTLDPPTLDTPTLDAPVRARRYEFLDSIRALAAWYVVLHHIWLGSFLTFPDNGGPWVTGWLRFGYLAVAVFIVVSGFSLALRPATHGDQLPDGTGTFLRRRAFRILPPYWVALLLSVPVLLLRSGAGAGIDVRSIAVHGALLQDVIASTPPNGAFWSIAIEWQIYFVFPLLIWLARRIGPWKMLGLTTGVVIAAQVAGQNVAAAHKVLDLTPQFLALFAMGLVAGRAAALGRSSTRPKVVAALIAIGGIAVLGLLAFAPPGWIIDQYFVVGLGVGAAIAAVVFALARGDFVRMRRILEHRPLPFIGSFSYSTYLLHLPVLGLVDFFIVSRITTTSLGHFVATLVIGLPTVFVVTYAFHLVFERPFVRHRTFGEVMRSIGRLPRTLTRPAPEPA